MKARVKGTTNIIEVEFRADALNNGYPPYYNRENNMYYGSEQLVWVDNEGNEEPDYWSRLEHQAAIAVMQGILNNSLIITGLSRSNMSHEDVVDEITDTATEYAHALVAKYKKEEKK